MLIVECPKRFCASFRFPVWALMKVPTECLDAWKPDAPDGRGTPSLSRIGYNTSFRSTSGSNGNPSFLQNTKSLGFFRSAASRCLFSAETSTAPRLIVRMLPFVFGAINCPRQRLCSICSCSLMRSTCFHCRPRAKSSPLSCRERLGTVAAAFRLLLDSPVQPPVFCRADRLYRNTVHHHGLAFFLLRHARPPALCSRHPKRVAADHLVCGF
jgi:hypothetical protein